MTNPDEGRRLVLVEQSDDMDDFLYFVWSDLKPLLFFFLIVYPATTDDRIYAYWERHKVLQDYPKPPKEILHRLFLQTKRKLWKKGLSANAL